VHPGRAHQRNVAQRLTVLRLTVPRNRRPAALMVTATVVIGGALAGGRAQAASPAPQPITIEPSVVGQAQLPVTFNTNDRFFANDVFLLDGTQLPFGPGNGPVWVGTTGGGGADLTLTAQTLSCGKHTLDDEYFVENTLDQIFEGTFTISCITATPGTVIGTREPVQITVAGGPFTLPGPATVEIDGKPAGSPVVPSGGQVNTAIPAQGLSCGPHTVTVTQTVRRTTITDTAPLAVTQCAQIGVNPAVLPDGTLTRVTGTGFIPNEPVTLTWQDTSGTVLDVCSANAVGGPAIVADASGAIDAFCLAPPHENLGAEQIAADQAPAGDLPGEHTTAPVVIEGGSMQPSTGGDFVFRR
jgi:hypothetical protein